MEHLELQELLEWMELREHLGRQVLQGLRVQPGLQEFLEINI